MASRDVTSQPMPSKRRRRQRYAPRVPKYRYERNLIRGLERRLHDYAPERGTDPGAGPLPQGDGGYVGARRFDQLPLSQSTRTGLDAAGYVDLTDIQRSALPHALIGRDVLGAARTGSGKTLVFLIAIIEKLYRLQWSRMDGLGALIISPVRELALQIFEELRKVGKHHDFSAGLLIGGKDVDVEKSRIGLMNILIATPGRLLHHLDESVGFDVTSLQVLVLDEADRLLDMGFARILDAIVAHLPKERQSMLFSATQTKTVQDLVRLSLSDPEYLAVHADAPTATPAQLRQFYVKCDLHEKLTVLWSFVKTHPHAKIIVFVSTCAQVSCLFLSRCGRGAIDVGSVSVRSAQEAPVTSARLLFAWQDQTEQTNRDVLSVLLSEGHGSLGNGCRRQGVRFSRGGLGGAARQSRHDL